MSGPSVNGERTDVPRKIAAVRECMKRAGVDGLRLRGVDWFAWATGGADSSVIFSNEAGVADVFITLTEALILTTPIEAARMRAEQIPEDFSIQSFPWAAGPEEFNEFVRKKSSKVWSDRPNENESMVPIEITTLKWTLQSEELERYRALGRDAAIVSTEALKNAHPKMTEWELAGLAARGLWEKGIHPLLTLVGGEERLRAHRHPVATNTPLGGHGMLVICGRRHGLFANFTRHVYFRPLTSEERKLHEDVAEIEAAAFTATENRKSSEEIYQALANRYRELGHADEITLHHQGGPTGYLSREWVARPLSEKEETNLALPAPAVHRAFAWNPSLREGVKVEDTVFLGADGKLEILTIDPAWPTRSVQGRARPWILERFL